VLKCEHEVRDIFWWMRKVGIHDHQNLASSFAHAPNHGTCKAAFRRTNYQPDRIIDRKLLANHLRPILAHVVNNYNFTIQPRIFQTHGEARDEHRQVFDFSIGWYDDGDLGATRTHGWSCQGSI